MTRTEFRTAIYATAISVAIIILILLFAPGVGGASAPADEPALDEVAEAPAAEDTQISGTAATATDAAEVPAAPAHAQKPLP